MGNGDNFDILVAADQNINFFVKMPKSRMELCFLKNKNEQFSIEHQLVHCVLSFGV